MKFQGLGFRLWPPANMRVTGSCGLTVNVPQSPWYDYVEVAP